MHIEDTPMTELGTHMKKALANTFCMYMLAHKYHFNVEGRNFLEYHDMFKTIYDELWLSVDRIAENIRGLDEYVPFNLERLQELSDVQDDNRIPTASGMMVKLLQANDVVMDSLNTALNTAKVAGNAGIENLLGERLETHAKHAWFMRSVSKTNRE
jgi:starvation-inducible DNA-binding protein